MVLTDGTNEIHLIALLAGQQKLGIKVASSNQVGSRQQIGWLQSLMNPFSLLHIRQGGIGSHHRSNEPGKIFIAGLP
jgi:hypothetical protein